MEKIIENIYMKSSKIIRRIVLISFLIIVVFSGLIYYSIKNIFPYSPIRPSRCQDLQIDGYVTPANYSLKWNQFNITVEDSISIKGWFIFSDQTNPAGTIIMMHGIGSCKQSMLSTASKFSKLGFNLILFDFRAHGESGGLNCTFGYYEKKDVSKLIDSAIARFQNLGRIAVYGSSLGAAVALQSMEYDKRISVGIAESPFANLRDVVYDYLKSNFWLPFRFISNATLDESQKIAHFQVDSVVPAESAKHISCPVLIAHGDKDEKISFKYGYSVYLNLSSKDKVWYPILNGHHNDLLAVGGEKYFVTITNFLKYHLSK